MSVDVGAGVGEADGLSDRVSVGTGVADGESVAVGTGADGVVGSSVGAEGMQEAARVKTRMITKEWIKGCLVINNS